MFYEVRYHLDEDPKTLKVFPIPLHDEKGTTLHYDLLSLSPDGKILAATHGSTLQWLCTETGRVLDIAEKAHDGKPNFSISPYYSFLCMFGGNVIWRHDFQLMLQ